MDRSASSAAILGTADAQHAQACRHVIEHLADRLADRMERAAAAGTDLNVNANRQAEWFSGSNFRYAQGIVILALVPPIVTFLPSIM